MRFSAENLRFLDLFTFSVISKRFYHISWSRKKFVSAMRISKHIFGFDDGYFKFLCSEMSLLGKDIVIYFFAEGVGRQLINVTSASGFLMMAVMRELKLIELLQLLFVTSKTPISHIWWTKLKLIGWSLIYTMLSEVPHIVIRKILVKCFLKLQTIRLHCMLCLCNSISGFFLTWWNR